MRTWLANRLAYGIYIHRFLKRNRAVRGILLNALGVFVASWVLLGPDTTLGILGLILRMVSMIGFLMIQFIGLFWFLSRSKSITIVPGDKTDLTLDDYKGQPALVGLMQEWLKILKGSTAFVEMGGLPPSGMILYGPPGTGKAVAYDEYIPTDGPPKLAGDVRVGDRLIGSDGKPTLVRGVFPQGIQPLYRVSFSDRTSARVTADHLWTVFDRRQRGWTTLSTQDMLNAGLRCEGGTARTFRVPGISAPAQLLTSSLPIHPYVLGLLLAEGGLTQAVVFSTSERDIASRVEALVPPGDRVTFYSKYQYGITGTTGYELYKLGLAGRKSEEKFIPWPYLYGAVQDRLELLRGLMDGDGSIDASRTGSGCEYTTVSPRLAEQVGWLVRSLGGTITQSHRIPSYAYHGTSRPGQEAHRLYIVMPAEINPFWLRRKADVFESYRHVKRHSRQRYIVSIDDAGDGEAVCFLVGAEDGLFCLNSFNLTHNTYLLKCLAGSAGIALHSLEGSSFSAMFIGVPVLKTLAFVNKARNLAREHSACIAYIDEIDALGSARGGQQGGMALGGFMGGSGGMGALTTLLAEVDGMGSERNMTIARNEARRWLRLPPIHEGFVFWTGGTNRPQVLDVALTRPGRLEHLIAVDPPDGPGRREIFVYYLDKVKNEGVDVDILVAQTQGITPAAIQSAIQRSGPRIALSEGRDQISRLDISRALIEQVMGLANPIGDLPQDQRWQICVHEASHAVASWALRKDQHIAFVSAIRRGAALGFMMPVQKESTYAVPLATLIADIRVSLAGDVGTRLILGQRWTGAATDLEHVRQRVQYLAWHGVFGGIVLDAGPHSPEMVKKIEKFMADQWDATEALLVEHEARVRALAEALLIREEMSGDEATQIIEGEVRE